MAKSLGGLLSTVLDSFAKGALGKAMTGAGLTFMSTTAMTAFVNQYISSLKNSTGGIRSEILGILHLSAIDYALSVILSAIVARIAINASMVHLAKKS